MSDALENLRSAWRSTARYSVYRTQPGTPKALLSSGLTYDEAKAAVEVAERAIREEPGYRPHVMGRAMALMQLEDGSEERFRALCFNEGDGKC